MQMPNWTELPFYTYLALGGGVVIVLAVILHFTPVSRLRLPGIVGGIIGGLAVGVGAGVIGMTYFGYRLAQSEAPVAPAPEPPQRMGLGGRGGPGGGGRGMFGGMRGPNSRNDLANLVAKLDLLTRKPLAVNLTDDQKQKVRDQLKGLDEQKELSEDEAKKRLEAILEIVKDQRDTLKNAGYRWPGVGGGRPPRDVPNPFQDGDSSEHLKSLLGQMGKSQT